VGEQDHLLARVAGEAVARAALEEPRKRVVAAGRRVNEVLPFARSRVRVVGDGRELCDQVGGVVGPQRPGAKVNGSVLDREQEGVVVEVVNASDHGLLGRREADGGTESRFALGRPRPLDHPLALVVVRTVRGVVQDRSGRYLRAADHPAGVVACPATTVELKPSESGDIADRIAVHRDEPLGIPGVGQRELSHHAATASTGSAA
jgi:hypothetical protein